MLHTISPQDMQEMERAYLEGTGYPSLLLMEHAAQAVADCLERYAQRAPGCCLSAAAATMAETAAQRQEYGCSAGERRMCGCLAVRLK